ncbi:pyrrolo-quinoline quinone [Sphingorhabdus lutea]|uniref:Pyrrolo-quinoline quinone n=1 Tax=Sphingorhabdus lutea TaxID=1913578 RepID=A0A1L3J909_9SPHN|nr:PQQ-binding-like beta-propeller repeat protein [Sphingorhabdus lutea]APG61591.1 pyrrolo-quinoline quinone [Sphingorhabdus lutea]
MTAKYKQLTAAVALSALLASCSAFGGKGEKKVTPTVGNRVTILSTQSDTDIDPSLSSISVILPAASVNAGWTQPGGNAAKAPGHVALPENLTRAWTASIAPASNRARYASTPVVSNNRLFVIDTNAMVQAFDAATGAKLWSTALETNKDGRDARFGGGVSVDGDIVYATNGVGDVAAIEAATGAIKWTKRPAGPLRGAPTISNGNAYVMTQDNQIYALRIGTGDIEWNEAGPIGLAGIFGVAAPAAGAGTVIAGYSTGELAAYRYENGRSLWNAALARTRMSTSVSSLTDIDADPVIDRGRIFALGQGGRMASHELDTGRRIWEINIAGISTPAVVGEWVFAMTDNAKLLCISRSTGKVRWISQLQKYRGDKAKKGPIIWRGPVLAGNRLISTNSEGQIWAVSTSDGTASMIGETKGSISVAPIVANNMLYILDDNGKITAYR